MILPLSDESGDRHRAMQDQTIKVKKLVLHWTTVLHRSGGLMSSVIMERGNTVEYVDVPVRPLLCP
jgi:hypothetical protein